MKTDALSALNDVFTRVLEDYAFMFGDLLEENHAPPADDRWVRAAMSFHGPIRGGLAITAPERFGGEVAANVLGIDAEAPESEKAAVDALKELLNITCGNLLTSIAGDEPVFDLTVPEVTDVTEQQWRAMGNAPATVGLQVEEWPVFISLSLENLK